MSPYADPVLVFNERRERWALHEPWSGQLPDGRAVSLPAGYTTDLASIPRIFWNIIAPFELSIVAPLVHDALCQFDGRLPLAWLQPYRTYTRAETDRLFNAIMLTEGVATWRRLLAFAAVRGYGMIHHW